MGEIPLFYELACQFYSRTRMPGYQEAFDKAMSEGEKPCLIILHIANKMPKIPYRNEYIQNLFIWRIAYMNEKLFGLHRPLQNSSGEISQVAVIEDHWETFRGRVICPPKLNVCQYDNLYRWAKDP